MADPRSRRRFLAACLAAMPALAIAGCGSTPTATPVPAPTKAPAAPTAAPAAATPAPAAAKVAGKLRVGIHAYMTQGIDFNKTVSKYTAATSGVQVEVIPIPAEESNLQAILQKMQLEAQQKKSSWDIYIGSTPFIEPGAMAKLGLIDSLDGLLPKSTVDDMYTGVLREVRYTADNKIYTFPWWSDVFGLIYRPSMLLEATGADKPPTTWDEILAMSEKIKAKYGSKIAAFGADWAPMHRAYLPILGTLTDKSFTAEGVVNLDDPAAREALVLLQKLYAYMPESSNADLGSSKAFQAGAVAMEIYWQTQLLRAIQAKQPEADLKMVGFPKGKRENTIFWTAGANIPKYSENKAAALDFMLKALIEPDTVKMSTDNWKIVPFKSVQKQLADSGKQPAWAPPLLGFLDAATPIPCNQYYLTVEQPVFREEIEKMLLKAQSVDDTLKNLKDRISKGVADVK